jgi:hypothetical protein
MKNDKKYLYDCYDCALMAAKALGWVKIDCSGMCEYRKIEDIQTEVYNIVINEIKKSNRV